jgi:2-hydroxychromene-2-carboxylate isomerase
MRATWYFDFISPFAYLQLGCFRDLPSELEITLKPVLFSAVRTQNLNPGVVVMEST